MGDSADKDDEARQLAQADPNPTAHETWLAGDAALSDDPDATDDVVSAS